MRKTLWLVLIALTLIMGIPMLLPCAQKPKPFCEHDIVRLLKGDVTPNRVAELARARGIDFQVTAEVEKELRGAGADDALLSVLREVAPKPVAPAVPPSTVQSAPEQPAERRATPAPGTANSAVRPPLPPGPTQWVFEVIEFRRTMGFGHDGQLTISLGTVTYDHFDRQGRRTGSSFSVRCADLSQWGVHTPGKYLTGWFHIRLKSGRSYQFLPRGAGDATQFVESISKAMSIACGPQSGN